MARKAWFAFALLIAAAALLLAGCTREPTGGVVLPAENGAGAGTGAPGQFPTFDQGGNIAVNLRLASDEIVITSQVSAKDTNTLAGVCDKVCATLGFKQFLLKLDSNRMYSCFCYREVCEDSEENGQIVRNCGDKWKMLYFKAI